VPTEHEPVLATELIDVLDPRPGEIFVDCTFGGGGHARLISERIGSEGELIAVDRDPASEERWSEFASVAPSRSRFLRADFVVALEGCGGGRSPRWHRLRPRHVLDAGGRLGAGFSYSYDAPLDMRMDPTQSLSAATVVNDWPQDRLANVIRELGEERRAGSIAREITKRRPIETTGQLVTAIKAAIPPSERFGRGHPAKRTFQAIRIAVNGELDALDHALPLAWAILPTGGRLGAISFHSLEDRRVKRFLADRARGCVCRPSSRSVSAGASRRPSCSPSARSHRVPRRSSGTRAPPRPVYAPRSRSARRRTPADGRRRYRSQG